MQFVTWQQMVDDAHALAAMMRGRGFCGVVAIPRSGYFPAGIVAQILGLPMVGLDHFAQHGFKHGLGIGRMAEHAAPGAGRILVIDDSSYRGGALQTARRMIEQMGCWEAAYAVLYGCDETPQASVPDVSLRTIARPRMFAWNWLGHGDLAHTLFDFDGVFCPDGPADEDPGYAAWLNHTGPLHLPTVAIRGIVTHRLEPWREATERWMKQHGLRADRLIMHPATTADERRREAYGQWKGRVYAADQDAMLFVESSITQSKIISAIAQKPVLCVEDWIVYHGGPR